MPAVLSGALRVGASPLTRGLCVIMGHSRGWVCCICGGINQREAWVSRSFSDSPFFSHSTAASLPLPTDTWTANRLPVNLKAPAAFEIGN